MDARNNDGGTDDEGDDENFLLFLLFLREEEVEVEDAGGRGDTTTRAARPAAILSLLLSLSLSPSLSLSLSRPCLALKYLTISVIIYIKLYNKYTINLCFFCLVLSKLFQTLLRNFSIITIEKINKQTKIVKNPNKLKYIILPINSKYTNT